MSEQKKRGNLLAAIPQRASTEAIDKLLERGPVKIERIVSEGHTSPPGFFHEQASHEWRCVVQGRVRLEFEEEGEVELGPGDWLDLPAYKRYRVVWTSDQEPTVWIAVHFYTFS